MSIKRGQISIGAARAEDRAPSHDGEYLAVYYKHGGGDWIIEGNAGVVAVAHNISDVLAAAADDAAYDEISRWQAEAEAIVDTDSGEDWNQERMGLESRELAEEFGWLYGRRFERPLFSERNKMAGDRILLECRICGWRWDTRRYDRFPKKCPNCLSLRWALGPRLSRQPLERAQADYDDPEAA